MFQFPLRLASARCLRSALATAVVPMLSVAVPHIVAAQTFTAEQQEVGRILQSPPTAAAGYVRYNFPRRDITLKVGDVTLSPAMASGAWLGFSGTSAMTTVMGDLVLLPGELKAVQAKLDTRGIHISAIHNHLAGAEPQLTYVHVEAMGNAIQLASDFDAVMRLTASPRPVAAAAPAPATIDSAMVATALGLPGKVNGAVMQFTPMLVRVPVTMHGMTVVPSQGFGTPINIQMVNADRFVATGDFSILADRVDAVFAALAKGGITATAMHSHLVEESPRVYYIHFWADGKPTEVLGGLRGALVAASQVRAER